MDDRYSPSNVKQFFFLSIYTAVAFQMRLDADYNLNAQIKCRYTIYLSIGNIVLEYSRLPFRFNI